MSLIGVDDFIGALADAVGFQSLGWCAATMLVEEAGLDSLDLYEILCTVEDWGGCDIPDDRVATWTTFANVYRCYANNRRT